MNNVNAISKKELSVKAQTLATVTAIVSAVVLPQLFHLAGAAAGVGSALGEIFLPMHLPILLVGLFAGPYAGAIAGVLAPAVSFLLTSMPSQVMLPFIMIELCSYGLFCGLMRSSKLPTALKVVIAQLAGRAVRAVAILVAVHFFESTVNASVIWNSIVTGLVGIALQLVIIPLAVYRLDALEK